MAIASTHVSGATAPHPAYTETVTCKVHVPVAVLDKAKQTARRERRSLQSVLDDVFRMEYLFFSDEEQARHDREMAKQGYR